jgi:hypothetical protein
LKNLNNLGVCMIQLERVRFVWPLEGHQTFSCGLRLYQDARRDLVVVSDFGDTGEVDTSITDQFTSLYPGISARYGLGGPGRKLLWVEHFHRGWPRADRHPVGRGCSTRPLWAQVVFVPKALAKESDKKLAHGVFSACYLAFSQARLEKILGHPWEE